MKSVLLCFLDLHEKDSDDKQTSDDLEHYYISITSLINPNLNNDTELTPSTLCHCKLTLHAKQFFYSFGFVKLFPFGFFLMVNV